MTTTEFLKKAGFTHDLTKKRLMLHGRLSAVLRMIETPLDSLEWRVTRDKSDAKECLFERPEHPWCGGSLDKLKTDLNGGINLKPFNKERDKLTKSDLGKKLQEKLAQCAPRRQRVMSEYDGEWDESRKWSIAPYQGVKKAQGPGRMIDIVAYSNVLGMVEPQELDKYGCIVWAVVEFVESMGINASVTLRYDSERISSGGVRGTFDIECKKAGEYLAPSLLASACQTVFFRRAIFALKDFVLDGYGETIDFGHGSSVQIEKPCEFKNGQIILSPNVSHGGSKELERVLLEAVG